MGKGKGRVSALFLNLKKEKTMDSYRKMNAFLTDADITTLQDLLHSIYTIEYVEIGDIKTPIVHTESEALNARIQCILLRLSEALENKETMFE
jgi:hypothetical protein